MDSCDFLLSFSKIILLILIRSAISFSTLSSLWLSNLPMWCKSRYAKQHNLHHYRYKLLYIDYQLIFLLCHRYHLIEVYIDIHFQWLSNKVNTPHTCVYSNIAFLFCLLAVKAFTTFDCKPVDERIKWIVNDPTWKLIIFTWHMFTFISVSIREKYVFFYDNLWIYYLQGLRFQNGSRMTGRGWRYLC